MSANNCFKTFGWIFDVIGHSEFDVAISDNVRVGLIFLFTFLSTLLILESRFVEVNLFTHNDGLD